MFDISPPRGDVGPDHCPVRLGAGGLVSPTADQSRHQGVRAAGDRLRRLSVELSLDLVPVPTIKDAYRLLDDDKVDAVVFDSPVLLYHAASAGKVSVEVVGPVFARQDYGIALPNGSPLRKEINATILSIIEDGR